jgi:hypothetical protein
MKNDDTKAYLEALKMMTQLESSLLVDAKKGSSKKFVQGTYMNRLVMYHFAQKLSPEFAVQVSLWLDNLFLTGKVELGNEKKIDELNQIWQQKYDTLQLYLNQEKQQNKLLHNKLSKILKRHQYLRLGVKGPCYYIYTTCDERLPTENKIVKIKLGIAGTGENNQLDDRLRSHRTTDPNMHLEIIITSSLQDITMLEQNMLHKYREKLVAPSHEILSPNQDLDELIESAKYFIRGMTSPDGYNILDQEIIDNYNLCVENTIKPDSN